MATAAIIHCCPASALYLRRKMSGAINHAEEVKEMGKWRMISYASLPVCAGE
jgi:hypothetical protein